MERDYQPAEQGGYADGYKPKVSVSSLMMELAFLLLRR